MYNDDAIEVIRDDIKRIRKRPEMYIGHRGTLGLNHLRKEILQNGIDELTAIVSDKEIKGDEIFVSSDDRDLSFIVEDNGRGIPQGKLEDICTVLQSSGKFNKDKENSTYKISAGENGVKPAPFKFI